MGSLRNHKKTVRLEKREQESKRNLRHSNKEKLLL